MGGYTNTGAAEPSSKDAIVSETPSSIPTSLAVNEPSVSFSSRTSTASESSVVDPPPIMSTAMENNVTVFFPVVGGGESSSTNTRPTGPEKIESVSVTSPANNANVTTEAEKIPDNSANNPLESSDDANEIKTDNSEFFTPTSSYGVITREEIDDLYANAEYDGNILLVDCRPSASFEEKRVIYSVNVPCVENGASTYRFASKSDIVEFLLEQCADFMGSLNAPGFYTDIIVYDEKSTAENLAKPVKNLLDAISKWNCASKTRTHLLQGGFQLYAAEYDMSYWLVNYRCLIYPWSFSLPKIEKYQWNESGSTPSPEAKLLIERVNAHLKNLDLATKESKQLLEDKRRLKSLEAVKLTLIHEQDAGRNKELEKLIPDDLKCPVCFEIFSGEIFQCTNGHCICDGCSQKLNACPTCKTAYDGGRIRTRILEKLMETVLKIDCPNARNGCKEKLLFAQVPAHVKVCGKPKSEQVAKIEEHIKRKERDVEIKNGQLETTYKHLMETELQWNISKQHLMAGISKDLLEEMYTRNLRLLRVKMALTLE